MIIAGRNLNDNMDSYIIKQVTNLMIKKHIELVDVNILIMGLTFKENCPDLRNSRVADLVTGFQDLNYNVDVYDPWVDKIESNDEYGIALVDEPVHGKYDAIILAVAHNEFKRMTLSQIKAFGKENHVLYDVKYVLKANQVDGRL